MRTEKELKQLSEDILRLNKPDEATHEDVDWFIKYKNLEKELQKQTERATEYEMKYVKCALELENMKHQLAEKELKK